MNECIVLQVVITGLASAKALGWALPGVLGGLAWRPEWLEQSKRGEVVSCAVRREGGRWSKA